MEARPDRAGANQGQLERLSDVVGVHMVNDAQAEPGQSQRLTSSASRSAVTFWTWRHSTAGT